MGEAKKTKEKCRRNLVGGNPICRNTIQKKERTTSHFIKKTKQKEGRRAGRTKAAALTTC